MHRSTPLSLGIKGPRGHHHQGKIFLSRISCFAAPQLHRVALVVRKEKGEDFIPSKEKNGGPRKQNCSASSLLHPHSNSQQANDFPVLSESQEQ